MWLEFVCPDLSRQIDRIGQFPMDLHLLVDIATGNSEYLLAPLILSRPRTVVWCSRSSFLRLWNRCKTRMFPVVALLYSLSSLAFIIDPTGSVKCFIVHVTRAAPSSPRTRFSYLRCVAVLYFCFPRTELLVSGINRSKICILVLDFKVLQTTWGSTVDIS